MKEKVLGRTGIRVSEIAFGGVEIGMPYGIGKEDMPAEEEAIRLLHAAVDRGVNFFDTARLYGRSEDIIGKAFRGMRDRVVISTKCVHLHHEDGGSQNGSGRRKMIEDSLHASLKALQTDHVDVFMLHNADRELLESRDVSDIFWELKKAGKTRAVGVSTYLPEETACALDTGAWDVIQLPFNLLDQRHKQYFGPAYQKGIGIVVRSVLFRGMLSDRGRNLHPALKKVEDHIASYNKLLNDQAPDMPALATKFALSFDEVSSVLVGIDKKAYLERSVQTADDNYLGEAALAHAEKLAYPDPAFLNFPYWDKMGWLK